MCRIAGAIDFSGDVSYNFEDVLSKMRDTMAYGGPDDAGSFVHRESHYSLGLGHRRLSIIDISTNGHQPMSSADGNIVITFNGEIYNYREIRVELLNMGFSFRTQSDTEVIIQAYIAWGIDSVNKFIGMFSYLLFDKKLSQVYAVRDRAGVKPLYYYRKNNIILFGSELKCFHQHPRFEKDISFDALALYFQYGYIPAPHSIFKNTYKLLPGHYLKLNLSQQNVDDVTYWSAINAYQQPLLENVDINEIIGKTKTLLKSACDYRMVSDVPVGVFLSGGYDSALVTALLQMDRTEKIKTFTIGFMEERYNEASFARKVAEHLGTDHTEYYCTQDDALSVLPLLPEIYDEPFGDSSAIPTTLVSRIARRSVKVALSADAGDEVFGGYNNYSSIIKLQQQLSILPGTVKQFAGNLIQLFNPEFLFAASARNTLSKRAGNFARILKSRNMAEMLSWLNMAFTEKQVRKVINNPFGKVQSTFNSFSSFGEGTDDINTMLALDYITYLPDDILTKVDRATMSVSLEGREPLLDHRLVEWMAQVPGNLKINNGIKKYILKDIVHQHIPQSMMDRPKKGFGIPVAAWFKQELKGYFDHYLDTSMLQKQGLLNSDFIQKKRTRYLSGDETVVSQLWFLLMFQMWNEKWMSP